VRRWDKQHKHGLDIGNPNGLRSTRPRGASSLCRRGETFARLASGGRRNNHHVKADSQAERLGEAPIQQEGSEAHAAIGNRAHHTNQGERDADHDRYAREEDLDPARAGSSRQARIGLPRFRPVAGMVKQPSKQA